MVTIGSRRLLLWAVLSLLLCAGIAHGNPLPKGKAIAMVIYENSQDPFQQGLDIGSAEAVVSRMLLEKGYPLVNQAQLKKIKESKAARLALDGDVEGIIKLGSSYNVRIFVTGKVARHRPVKNPMGTYTATAAIAVRAYSTANGKYIFSDTADAKALGGSPDEASEKALQEAARAMGSILTGSQAVAVSPGASTNITLKVSGVSDFSAANRILDACKNLSGTVSAKVSAYSGGNAAFSVVFRGDSKTFVKLLSSKGVKLSIKSVGAMVIEAEALR
ncbi:MAG: hypothetical protein EOM02_12030 [Synergistales bacterium]|nr:hypothetical protein [Synergistales bacterium]